MQTAGIVGGHQAANIILEGVQADIVKAPPEVILIAHGEIGVVRRQQPPRQARLEIHQLRQVSGNLKGLRKLQQFDVKQLRTRHQAIVRHIEIAQNGPIHAQGLRHFELARQRQRAYRRACPICV
jgi:hypothetical protein